MARMLFYAVFCFYFAVVKWLLGKKMVGFILCGRIFRRVIVMLVRLQQAVFNINMSLPQRIYSVISLSYIDCFQKPNILEVFL